MLPWVRQAFQPAPLLVGREVVWSTRGVQQGDPLGPFLFAAGVQAALDALPPGRAIHRWYLDDGVFMGSVAEVEGVLTAVHQTLPPPLRAQPPDDDRVGSGPGARGVPARSSDTPVLGRRHRGAESPDPIPPLPITGGGPLGCPEGQVRAHMRGRSGPGGHPERPCAHAVLPGAAKVQYALRTLHIRHTAAFAADVTANQRATWDAVVGTPTSDAAWWRTTLQLSECGCGVASTSDVAPVARLAGVNQFLARAEPFRGCDRQLVLPLATEAGPLDALNARLPLALEPLASWTRTGKVELPDGDVRRQHRWSARLTQMKAAVLLEAATGRDVRCLEAQRAGKAGGWLSPPPPLGGPGGSRARAT